MVVPGTAQEHKRRLESELRVFVDRWSRDTSIKRIILFGSVARGDIHCGSDLDLIIVQKTNKKFLSRLEPFYRDARVAMDILVYTPEEFVAMTDGVFLKNALRDGVVIYETGSGKGRKQMGQRPRACVDGA